MNLYEKINAIMESVESLQKDGKVAFNTTKYNYLSESKTTAEMRKQLVKHKLIILPIGVQEEVKGSITQGKYTYKLVNAENPEEFIILESGGQGHDSADKGSGKASSYAYKYLLWRTFAIPSNDDPDQISSNEITEQEKAKSDQKASEPMNKNKYTKQADTPPEAAAEIDKIANRKINAIELEAIKAELKRTGVKEGQIISLEKCKAVTLHDLTFEQWRYAMTKLEKTITKKQTDFEL